MKKYDAILIDADDTLFEFDQAERSALHKLLLEMGLDNDQALSTYHACNDACWRALERGEMDQAELKYKRFADFLAVLNRTEDAVSVGDRYIQLLACEGGLLPGALETVQTIAAQRPIAIVTNGITRIQNGRMAVSGLNDYVSALIISEEVGVAKPNPRMIEAALHALGGVAPQRALMVGDSLTSDIECALRAGVDACWLNAKGAQAPQGKPIAYEIRDIRELVSIALT